MPPFEIDASLAARLVLFCLAIGAVAGLLAGMLGVGGGIVVVPALYFALGHLGVDEAVRMKVAVATSLATIVPTSILSARTHRQRGSVDGALLRAWSLPALGGAAIGTLFAASVKGPVLAGIFGAIAMLVAFQMVAFPGGLSLRPALPGRAASFAMAGLIGGFSAIMGIGGGTLAVPVLSDPSCGGDGRLARPLCGDPGNRRARDRRLGGARPAAAVAGLRQSRGICGRTAGHAAVRAAGRPHRARDLATGPAPGLRHRACGGGASHAVFPVLKGRTT
jgi:hypothetical protein